MSGFIFIVGLILCLLVIGGCITWAGRGLVERNGPSFFGYMCITLGNSLMFFPLSIALLGHGVLAYIIGSVTSAGLALFLLNRIEKEADW